MKHSLGSVVIEVIVADGSPGVASIEGNLEESVPRVLGVAVVVHQAGDDACTMKVTQI